MSALPERVRSLRIENPPREQHGVGPPVSDEEEEGVVGMEHLRLRCRTNHAGAEGHDDCGGGCRLGALLVDLDERLVDDLGNLQRSLPDAAEVGFVAEGQLRMQAT
jgi:hypothetical protein